MNSNRGEPPYVAHLYGDRQRDVLTGNTLGADKLVDEVDEKVWHFHALCVVPFVTSEETRFKISPFQ